MITLRMILVEDGKESLYITGKADPKDLEKLADYMVSALRQKRVETTARKNKEESQ